jgi:uracil-DNA glycosylase
LYIEGELMSFCPFELEPSWMGALGGELQQPYVAELAAFVEKERRGKSAVYPPKELVFNAFFKTPFDKVKVLLIGQDPYHGPGQAHGLSFSVPPGIPQPPSLQNIFKELQADLGISPPGHGCLTRWAEQGVMLLNAILTVRQGEALSHQGKGWERLTDAVVKALFARQDPVIFVLWGKSAQEKCRFFNDLRQLSRHTVLKAPHPSPFSAHTGFLGCRHFSKINQVLTEQGKGPINWLL